jgi:hypothetical protein
MEFKIKPNTNLIFFTNLASLFSPKFQIYEPSNN